MQTRQQQPQVAQWGVELLHTGRVVTSNLDHDGFS